MGWADEEPIAQAIDHEINATHPGRQQIPPEIGNEPVPDVVLGGATSANTARTNTYFTRVDMGGPLRVRLVRIRRSRSSNVCTSSASSLAASRARPDAHAGDVGLPASSRARVQLRIASHPTRHRFGEGQHDALDSCEGVNHAHDCPKVTRCPNVPRNPAARRPGVVRLLQHSQKTRRSRDLGKRNGPICSPNVAQRGHRVRRPAYLTTSTHCG